MELLLKGAYLLRLLPVVVLLLKCAYVTLVRYYVGADRDKVRQRGSGAESRARALSADQGLYTRN